MMSRVKMLTFGTLTLLHAKNGWAQSAEGEAVREPAPELAAASGITGAGTRFGAEASARAWAEIGISQIENITAAWSVFGVGVRVHESVEIEALMPIGYGWQESSDVIIIGDATGASAPVRIEDGGDQKQWLGNPYLGANFLHARESWRVRAGAGIGFPLASWDERSADAEYLVPWAAGMQDIHLWLPRTFSVIARGRVETSDDPVVFAGDLALIGAFPVADEEPIVGDGFFVDGTERKFTVLLQPAVELAFLATPSTLAGVRIPLVWSSESRSAEVSFAPFVRQGLGPAFVAAQVNFNSGPEGLDGGIWGAQLGAGSGF